ncbi:M1 family aminopeptidase [Myroides odoratus]|uniref:ABC transporter permease/M1 family aminopeptidase n=1 Tax=Myroides odoratus TaxID=256 RepID=UPI0039B0A12A
MFGTVFSFELKRWFKSWVFYLYLILFFGISFMTMLAAIGVFDGVTNTTASLLQMNSAYMLNGMISSYNTLLYFLFPSIIGMAIYRDYKYNVHHILYSYPFSKGQYLLGKFSSSFLITLCISMMMGLGAFLATLLPWGNQALLGPNDLWNYVQIYVINLIPNMLFMGAIIFTVVTLSRSIYAGFITIIILMVLKGLIGSIAADVEYRELGALLDPSGDLAIKYYTRYWSIDELNSNDLPLEKFYLFNRSLWLGISLLTLLILGKVFKFSQQPATFSFKRKIKGERLVKNNFGGIFKIELPKVHYNFSNTTNWSNIFAFAKLDFKFLARNRVFWILIGVGLLFMILVARFAMTMYGTPTYPLTRQMLTIPGSTFQFFILMVTFLGAGLLVHRGELARMNLLVDSTAVPNWVLFISKFFALIGLQLMLLVVIMITSMGIQAFNGYYQFEIDLYLQSLLGYDWIEFIIWALMSLAVQTFFKNYIVGFFVLLVLQIGWPTLSHIGIEQELFFFNSIPTPTYSDMNGFGSTADFGKFIVYVLYWVFFVAGLSGLTLLFWRRGTFNGIKERFYYVKKRAKTMVLVPTLLFFVSFLCLGSYLYYENTVLNDFRSSKESELLQVAYEKTYRKYQGMAQPRIVDVKVDVDLFPEKNNFQVRGTYLLTNKTNQALDTLLVAFYQDFKNDIIVEGATLLSTDSIQGFSFYRFNQPMQAGETRSMEFVLENKANSFIRSNSPVLNNGTFLNNSLFPSLGYSDRGEIMDDEIRKKYGLEPKERMAEQTDKRALQNTYISNDADWIHFETTVSTSADQIAIAPGYLQKEWTEGTRRYFHYKMDQKMLNFYAFNSARYEVKRDKWKDINLEIYYHKGHEYNIDRMMSAVKKSLEYYSTAFSPYQHKQVRIIEFPLTMGSFAQSFANTIPFSETIGFVANVDDTDEDAVDYPFSVTAHEVAHQWWAHQVIGANVQGATMLSESLSEYSSLKVLEKEYGKGQMQRFLKDALDGYLGGRSNESKKEKPLMYNENQQYIHYNKGSLVFYTMSDYLGDSVLNGVLKDYVKKVAFQEAPYTISAELVEDIKLATPDSLQYMVKDMFETITLYDNYVDKVEMKQLKNGKYEVKIKAYVSKYRAGDKGEKIYADKGSSPLVFTGEKNKKIESLPLADYIEIGVFAKDQKEAKSREKALYLQKVKITAIENEFTIIVDEKPTEVGIDPYYKLIDTRSYDNRKAI